MLKIIGFYDHSLYFKGDVNDPKKGEIDRTIPISSILSYSIYSNHAVWITNEGQGFAVGDNRGYNIIGTLEEKEYFDPVSFDFFDEEGHKCKLLSVVCGACYTLYHVQSRTPEEPTRLAVVQWDKNKGVPLFLNLSGRNPIRLFGGRETSAAIDSNGSIIIITDSVFDDPSKPPPIFSLPDGEKATCVACGHNFIAALSLSGKLYNCKISSIGDVESIFKPVNELAGIRFVQVSATWDHRFAVSEDGRVFARGSNSSGQIGFKRDTFAVSKYTQVQSLSKYKIVYAFAGYMHSLFITKEGTLLACGRNSFQLLLPSDLQKSIVFHEPVETTIKKNATFAIAGPEVSAVFVDGKPPQSMPNLPIKADEFSDDFAHAKARIEKAGNEDDDGYGDDVPRMKEVITQLKKEKVSLLSEVEQLRRELKESNERQMALEKRIAQLEGKP